MPRRAWVWRSMKPGETTCPAASMTRAAWPGRRGPIATMVSPVTATSPRYHGDPVPSTMRPPLMSRSYEGVCADGSVPRSSAETRASGSIHTRGIVTSRGRGEAMPPIMASVLVEMQFHLQPPPRLEGDEHRDAGQLPRAAVHELEARSIAGRSREDLELAAHHVRVAPIAVAVLVEAPRRRQRHVVQPVAEDVRHRDAGPARGGVPLP